MIALIQDPFSWLLSYRIHFHDCSHTGSFFVIFLIKDSFSWLFTYFPDCSYVSSWLFIYIYILIVHIFWWLFSYRICFHDFSYTRSDFSHTNFRFHKEKLCIYSIARLICQIYLWRQSLDTVTVYPKGRNADI